MHDINAELAPGQLGRVTFCADQNSIAVDHQVIAVNLNRKWKRPVGGVMPGQMRVGARVAKIVDRNDLNLTSSVVLIYGAQYIAPDTTISIDCDFCRHACLP